MPTTLFASYAARVEPRPNDDRELLQSLGIAIDGKGMGELKAACSRIARRIRSQGLRVVGFVPCDDDVAVPPLLIQLGLALCDLTGTTIAVVDANVRYPGLAMVSHGKQADQ